MTESLSKLRQSFFTGNKLRWAIPAFCFLILFTATIQAQGPKPYDKMRQEVDTLLDAGKTAEAIQRLNRALNQFPGNTYSITSDILHLCLQTKDFDRLFKTWEYGLERGYFFHIHAHGPRGK